MVFQPLTKSLLLSSCLNSSLITYLNSSLGISLRNTVVNSLLFISLLFSSVVLFSNAHASTSETAKKNPSVIKSHAIAMHGTPKYPANFKQFEYTSEKAVKGGAFRLHRIGTYDSLNPYIPKGNPAINIGLLYDTLTAQAFDEPFTQYGLIAETIEYPEDRSWVIFNLRPNAAFHDGHTMTAEDVVFTFNLLMEKGSPLYSFYYADVTDVEALDTHRVKFTFKDNKNLELALIVGQLPVLPKHFWEDKEFSNSDLTIPLGSGPYTIKDVDAGRNITYIRDDNYWGKDLAVNKGMYNFDTISIDYYRDSNVAIEALKANEYDYRWENSSKSWATAYDIASVEKQQLRKQSIAHSANSGMQAFIFNLRKPIFQDMALRKAINYAFDFEWSNQTLFYNAYQRTNSFFVNSELAATGLPDEGELKLLQPLKEQLPSSVFTDIYAPPVSDGKGRNRQGLRAAKKLLDNTGYYVKDNQLFNADNEAISFEILLASPTFERVVNPFIKSLSQLGITVNSRLVDTSQYINRARSFDFDMMIHVFAQAESPGNEQRDKWGSAAADTEGSSNLIGIKNPAIDQLIEHIIVANGRDALVTATHALDRALLHNHYLIPQWYKPASNLVYWDKFGIPEIAPAYDKYYTTGIFTWWYDQAKAEQLEQSLNQ